MRQADEEWASLELARALEECHQGNAEEDWREAAARLNLPVEEVFLPNALPALYVPELFTPTPEPRGVIVVNMAHDTRTRACGLRHEIGHHFLWVAEPNVLFGRRFPLDRLTEAYLLRERIVRRAERLWVKMRLMFF